MPTAPDVVIEHPNRDKAASHVVRVVVVLLLLVTAALLTIITIGGWDALQGMKPLQIAYIAVNLALAYYVARWNRGVLPVAAALAIILMIFAIISAPGWFDRDKEGFADPAINEDVLGTLTAIVAPVQLLVIVVAMIGFAQKWNVEYERPRQEPPPQQRLPAPA